MLNKVILMGRITAEPELRYTTSNTPVCSFTLAVERDYKDSEGNRQADFINCQAWRNTAEFVCKYFTKGQPIVVVGKIQTRTWEDQEGKKHYATEVVVDNVYFAGSSKKNEQSTEQSDIPEGFIPVDDSELPF
mgnify:FL=1